MDSKSYLSFRSSSVAAFEQNFVIPQLEHHVAGAYAVGDWYVACLSDVWNIDGHYKPWDVDV